jgi:hypothetical protein
MKNKLIFILFFLIVVVPSGFPIENLFLSRGRKVIRRKPKPIVVFCSYFLV